MKLLTIIIGALLITVGLFCMFTPGLTMTGIGWLLGLMLALAGISQVVNHVYLYNPGQYFWALLLGVTSGVMGLFLLVNHSLRLLSENMLLYVLGVWLLAGSVLHIIGVFLTYKQPDSAWRWSLCLGIIMAVMGFYSLMHPSVLAIALAWLVGAYIVISGVNLITFAVLMQKTTDGPDENDWDIANQ